MYILYMQARMHTHYASTHACTCTHIHIYTYTRHIHTHSCTHAHMYCMHTPSFTSVSHSSLLSLSHSLPHPSTEFPHSLPPLPSPPLPPLPPLPSLPSLPPSPPRLVSYELLNESLTEPLKLIISSRSLFFFSFSNSPPDPHSLLERVDLSDLRECRPVTGKTSECGEGVVCVCIPFSFETDLW